MNSNRIFRLAQQVMPTCALLIALCTPQSVEIGGSSGTEISEITGTITDHSGNPVEGAIVRLRPLSFLSTLSDDSSYRAQHSIINAVSDDEGFFILTNLLPDSFVVEVTVDDTLGSVAECQIFSRDTTVSLPAFVLEPVAEISGSIEVSYYPDASVKVQVYGLDRSVNVDSFGNFRMQIPKGKHLLHFGATLATLSDSGEFDHFDLSLEVYPGEHRDAGSFNLRPPPPESCSDGTCDSTVVRMILSTAGKADTPLDSVTESDNGRIVSLNLRGFNLSKGIPYDVNRLAALRVLDIGNTGLPTMFPDIGRLVNLESVSLDNNMLEYFATTAGRLTKLHTLDLHSNRIGILHASLLDCTGLESLDVGGNKLCSVWGEIADWLDTKDPDWRASQWCK
jgi:Leucine-rich repeat (LRR) protein